MNLIIFLEEVSARDLLTGLLPRILPEHVQVSYQVFAGKQDLEGKLVRRLRGWQKPNSVFAVVRDQDAADCSDVRARLRRLVDESGRAPCLVRVACRELESWILGDWPAVAKAFDRPKLAALSAKESYRDPDILVRPVEELRKHLPDYQKRDGARRLGALLDPGSNKSKSFRAFCDGVRRLVQ